jgi:hypothetical protein
MKPIKLVNLLAGIAVVSAMLSACLPGPTQARQNEITTNAQESSTVHQVTQAEATAMVEHPRQNPANQPQNGYSYEGIQITLNPAIAASASGQTLAENKGETDGPYWEALPKHIKISLSGYPLTGTMHEPVIYIYPVEDFRHINEPAVKEIDDLRSVLAKKPAEAEFTNTQIPFLPIWNAGQTFHSNIQYLDFQNGSGVRFLAEYAQYPAPVNNHDLFYTFQGLTADGRYVISAILPISHPTLPESADALSINELDTIAQNYGDHHTRMSALLMEAPNETFLPNLGKLDEMMMSLRIE